MIKNWELIKSIYYEEKKMKGAYPSRKRSQSIISRYYLPLRTFCLCRYFTYYIYFYTYSLVFASLEQIARKFDGLDKYADTRTSFIITVMGPVVPRRLVAIFAVGNNPKSMAVVGDARRTVRNKSREIMEDT